MTGKCDRWGRDRVGRSEPAFLSASTIALPPINLHCTAIGRPTSSGSCCFAARPANCWLLFLEACAGQIIRRLCPPAVVCSAGCVPAVPSLPAMPTAHVHFAPVQVCLPRSVHCAFVCPCSLPCAPGSTSRRVVATVCKLQDCPVGSCNTGLQWRPVRRFIC